MRKETYHWHEAEQLIGQDDMVEILSSLEREDESAVDAIMTAHPIDYIIITRYVNDERQLDIIFIKL